MENLFVYGTLQQEKIQIDIFGKRVPGKKDILPGYEKYTIRIPENAGGSSYPAIKPSLKNESKVKGIVLPIQEKDLILTDRYEGNSYFRKKLKLESGISAWTYIAKDQVNDASSAL